MLISQEYQETWSSSKKILFKFIFSYFALYIILMFTSRLFETPFKWVGKTFLDINYSYDVNGFGSGDHTYAYVVFFINLALAIIVSTTWILFERRRKNYNKLLYWFIVSLRIFLVFFMFAYGFVKLIQLQFPYPSLTRMLEPLGHFSPMGLAWTYLGYSQGYNLFMGIMEVTGGLLLIPRRTSTLGAFITAGVMMHVVVMNFMFDIPVKLFSTHLTLMALFIFSTDLKRFIHVFIINKPTSAYHFYHPIEKPSYHKAILWVKSLGLVLLIGVFLAQGLGNSRGKHSDAEPHLYGIWEVSQFIKNGDTLAPLITDEERWRYLIVDYNNTAVRTMDDENHFYRFEPDSISQKAKMYSAGSAMEGYNFSYQLLDSSKTLKLHGKLHLNDLDIELKRKELLLHSRGFHWINEKPLNH